MSIAKRIAAKRAEQDRIVVEVEEWGDEDAPLRLFATPITVRDVEKLQRKHKDFLQSPTLGAMVDLLIAKCEDEAGEKAFTLEDRSILLGEPPAVIARIFGDIFGAEPVEEHSKN